MPTNQPERSHPLSVLGLPLTTIVAATCLGPAIVSADIAFDNYEDDSTFAFIVQDMPDFDQVRTGDLPNNGICYCGPASTSNLLAYAATHGFPDVEPGIPMVSWQTQSSYDDISDLMFTIGDTTGTSPGGVDIPCGVGPDALHSELVRRLGDRFTIRNSVWNPSEGYAPDAADIAFRGSADQAVGLMLYGHWAGSTDNGRWISNTRRGGHFEAVNQAIAGGGLIRLGLRNPNQSMDSGQSQSAFATHWFDVTRSDARINGSEVGINQLDPIYSSRNEDLMQIFESYLSISPKASYSWDDVTNSIIRHVPAATLWSPRAVERTVIEMPGNLQQVAFGPSDIFMASIVDGKILRSHRGFAGKNAHQELRVRANGWNGARDLAFDSQRRLHVVGGDLLATFDWDRRELLSVLRLPGEGTSIAIENGIVHVLIPEMELVAAVNQGPDGAFTVELPLPDDALVRFDSTIDMLPGGRLFLLSDGVVNPMQITDAGFQRLWIPVPRDGDWEDLAVDDHDTLCMVDGNGLVEAYQVGPDGFERNPRHALDGSSNGSRIAVARSTTNRNPEIDTSIDLTDIGPDRRRVELDCLGDLNFDRTVDAGDIGLLLGEWSTSRSIADLDRDGIVDSADLGLLLGSFGVCP